MRNAYARLAGVRTGSVGEEEFAGFLEEFRPWQGLAAMYLVAAGWRSGGSGHNPGMPYVAAEARYDSMPYRRCGRSGIKLPAISLGLWNRFGDDTPIQNQRDIIRRAFDLGITHIDLANNYGPPTGRRRSNFGRMMADDLRPYRDELIISTKAGYDMWPGPVRRLGLAQVPDRERRPEPFADGPGVRRHLLLAPLRSGHAAGGDDRRARDRAVRQGKALYVGISSYSPASAHARRSQIARSLGTPILIHQPSLLDAQPLDRARGAGHLRRAGRRDHRLLAARPGHAHRPLPRRHPRGLARGARTTTSRRTSSTTRTWRA